MLALLLLILAAFAVAAAIYLQILAPAKDGHNWPLYPRKPLSDPEQVLYFRLREAFPECIVLAQVEISRVIGVKRSPAYGAMRNILAACRLTS